MKASFFFIGCVFFVMACKKSENIEAPSGQVLDRVVRSTIYNSMTTTETINYEYDASGRIIAEGGIKYTRDPKGRIINIQTPPDGTNRNNIDVYYIDGNSGKIAYTVARMGIPGAKDSSVYERDNNGRIARITSYYGKTAMDYYYTLSYDVNGNLKVFAKYSVSLGYTSYCGGYSYEVYDDHVNPSYSDDEARILPGLDALSNTGKNNVISSNHHFSKSHTYRADGKPLSCKIFDGGAEVARFEYYYK